MGPFYRVLFIVAYRHIAITQVECGHGLQTIK